MKDLLIIIFLNYLKFFSKLQLKKINPIVVGIGGASGKTSVALLTSNVLSQKYKVKFSEGKNSQTGIPLSILGIDIHDYSLISWFKILLLSPWKIITNWEKYDYFVVEMGIDSPFPPKNMEFLLTIVRPDMGVLTNINIEHSVFFDSIAKSEDPLIRKEEILLETAKQEGMLLKSIPESGRTFLNIDDPSILGLLPLKSKVVTISWRDKKADFYISKIEIEESSFKVRFTYLKEEYDISLDYPLPRLYAYSLIFPIAIAFFSGFSIRDSINLIEKNFQLPPGRFSTFKGIKDTLIIDSSYNSSFEPAKGALEAVKEIAGNRRKVGILADMRELGSISKIQHELLGKEIAKNLDYAILIGPMMKDFVSPVLDKQDFKYKAFETFREAKEEILGIQKRDVILVKGSQNTLFLERAVEALLADKRDIDKLCRRGRFWDKMRRKSS